MDAAQRVLMNEFKQLSKEKWTNIEVSPSVHAAEALQRGVAYVEHPANRRPADQRERL